MFLSTYIYPPKKLRVVISNNHHYLGCHLCQLYTFPEKNMVDVSVNLDAKKIASEK